jgi:hypothetical protein
VPAHLGDAKMLMGVVMRQLQEAQLTSAGRSNTYRSRVTSIIDDAIPEVPTADRHNLVRRLSLAVKPHKAAAMIAKRSIPLLRSAACSQGRRPNRRRRHEDTESSPALTSCNWSMRSSAGAADIRAQSGSLPDKVSLSYGNTPPISRGLMAHYGCGHQLVRTWSANDFIRHITSRHSR